MPSLKDQIIQNIEIQDLGAEGNCIARYDNKVIFVPFAAPNDLVDLKITRNKKNYAEAVILKMNTPSIHRQDPFCKHFGICGGCKLQHIKYETQLSFKTKQVKDNFERIGKIEFPEILPIIASGKDQYYRNKLEFTFSNRRWLTNEEVKSDEPMERNTLGFHVPGRFDKVLEIDHCYLQRDPSNTIRKEVLNYALKNKLSFFDLKDQFGLLRNIIIRTSGTGEIMVIIQFFEKNETEINKLLEHLKNTFSEITALLYIINQKGNDTYHDQEVITYSGKDYITEKMEALSFRIGAKSFYQTNSEQAYVLYKIARDFAGLTGTETVYDLYTGTGTIANFVAHKAAKVVGVEYIPMAIEDAKINSSINNIHNTSFFAGDMKDVLNESFLKENGQPDVIITDPPRAGMHEDVVKMLLKIAAQKIIYISCNPATQARDLAWMDAMYKVTKVQPVDMFPHTHHVENVVLLEKR